MKYRIIIIIRKGKWNDNIQRINDNKDDDGYNKSKYLIEKLYTLLYKFNYIN